MLTALSNALVPYAAMLLLLAATWDFCCLRIPNPLPWIMALLFVAYLLPAVPELPWAAHLICGASVLTVGFLLFASGWIGGGDAKLLAAAALWAGPAELPVLLALTAASGGLFAILLWIVRPRLWLAASALPGGLHHLPRALEPGAGVPYGVAIAAGGLAALPL